MCKENYNLIVEQLYLKKVIYIQIIGWLFEAKTCTKEQESFSIKREWLDKLKQESFAMNKEYYSLVFDFGSNNNFYILDEDIFKQILELLNEVNNDERGNK